MREYLPENDEAYEWLKREESLAPASNATSESKIKITQNAC